MTPPEIIGGPRSIASIHRQWQAYDEFALWFFETISPRRDTDTDYAAARRVHLKYECDFAAMCSKTTANKITQYARVFGLLSGRKFEYCVGLIPRDRFVSEFNATRLAVLRFISSDFRYTVKRWREASEDDERVLTPHMWVNIPLLTDEERQVYSDWREERGLDRLDGRGDE